MTLIPTTGLTRIFSRDLTGVRARTFLRETFAIRTSPRRNPSAAYVTGNASVNQRLEGKPNAALFRNWAEHAEWVRAALNIRRDQVAKAEWVVEPEDSEQPFDAGAQKAATDLIKRPNAKDEDWETWIRVIVEDLLVLDAGCVEKERTLGGDLYGLHAVDGALMRIDKFWDGDPDEFRYYWCPDGQPRAGFKTDDFMYWRANPMSYRVVGLAPLETLKLAVDGELSGQAYNTRQIKAPAPDGILDLGEQARPELVEKFKQYWATDVAGRGALAFLGGSRGAKFMQMRMGNREMQFIEYQLYLTRKIAAVFGMSLQDLGVPLDTNRATAQVTSGNTDDRGLQPLLNLVERAITRGVVRDRAFGGPDNNLRFRFTALNLRESLSRATVNEKALAGMPWKFVDEARSEDGRPEIGGALGNSLIISTPQGPMRVSSEEDIPTPREFMEAKMAKAAAAPAGPARPD